MKKFKILSMFLGLSLFVFSCEDDEEPMGAESQSYKVTIENIATPKAFFASGVFNTPVGDDAAGPATPGKEYQFSFYAPKGSKLSFATMFGQSNDLFYAPEGTGIALYDGDNGITGNITDQIKLWDAGTEMNEEPGAGPNQAPRQTEADMGTPESEMVREIAMVNDGYTYPAVDEVLDVDIEYMGASMFQITLANVSTPTTLMTTIGDMPAPHSPGVWVVHTADNPLFTAGEALPDNGLERIAEEGNPEELWEYVEEMSGYVSPISPGVWAIADANTKLLFEEGAPDMGDGLERLAEEGNTDPLHTALMGNAAVTSTGVFNTPVGGSAAGPIFPGGMYEFNITLNENERFFFATMLGNSNDFFFALDDTGTQLTSSGDISNKVYIWDAGTEVDEYPGAGPNQAPRQAAPDTGAAENGNVIKVNGENDGFMWPLASDIIKVTISPTSTTEM